MPVKRCGNCSHPVYRHDPEDRELCRIEGCTCPGFLTRVKTAGLLLEAVAIVRFAHHEHAFGDEYCTPANCSVAAWLASHGGPSDAS